MSNKTSDDSWSLAVERIRNNLGQQLADAKRYRRAYPKDRKYWDREVRKAKEELEVWEEVYQAWFDRHYSYGP